MYICINICRSWDSPNYSFLFFYLVSVFYVFRGLRNVRFARDASCLPQNALANYNEDRLYSREDTPQSRAGEVPGY